MMKVEQKTNVAELAHTNRHDSSIAGIYIDRT